jgi:hypothetical protein
VAIDQTNLTAEQLLADWVATSKRCRMVAISLLSVSGHCCL